MQRKDSKPKSLTESRRAKSDRRRALKIIRATRVYNEEFCAMVQDALDNDPSRLPRLFAAADEMDKGREEIDQYFKELMRRPHGIPNAACIRELLADHQEYIAQRGFEMARFLENPDADGTRWEALASALVELSNETGIYYFHPGVVECFFRQAVITAMEKGTGGKPDQRTQRILNEIQALLNDATPKPVIEEIASLYNGESVSPRSAEYLATIEPTDSPYRPIKTRNKPAKTRNRSDGETQSDPEVERLRDKLTKLERLPENEATAFQLESEIYKLEREASNANEWPDVIGGADA